MKRSILLFFVLILFPSFLFADGIEVPYGTRALSLGKAFSAVADDASAMYWNPAGLTQLKGWGGEIDYLNIKTDSTFKENTFAYAGDNTFQAADKTTHIPGFGIYYGYDKMTIGFGAYAISGLTSDYTQTDVKLGAQIGIMNVGPSVAYRLTDELSVGAGLGLVLAQTSLQGSIDMANVNPLLAGLGVQDFSINTSGSSWNANLGTLYQFNKDLKVGISYRLPRRVIVKGQSKFLDNEQDLTSAVDIAGKLNAGVAYRCPKLSKLLTTAEISVTQWSKALASQDSDFKDPMTDAIFGAKSELNGKNNVSYSLGAEYNFNEKFTGRLGLYTEGPATIPGNKVTPAEYLLRYNGATLGATYNLGMVSFNLGYSIMSGSELSNNSETLHPLLGVNVNPYNGTYHRDVNILMLGVNVKL